MLDPRLAESLIQTLPVGREGLFNPWREVCIHDVASNTPQSKLERLAQHLDCNPSLLMIGEAPGYQGCRYSGIAFTSERLLGEGAIPRVPVLLGRLSSRPLPFSEPSATIVWKTLYRLGLADRTVLWNAMQLHPFQPGNVWSNRTPTADEIALGAPGLHLLREAFPLAKIVAVGKKAEGLLFAMGVPAIVSIRHPANGGANVFAAGLESFVREKLL